MTIKEVSEKCGVSRDTLRYYEKMGMIMPVCRNESGFRTYSEEDIRWIELAKCMRSAGLSVEAVAEYVRLYRMGDDTISDRLRLLTEQCDLLEKQREQIDVTMKRLQMKIARYKDAEKIGGLQW